VSKGEGYVTNHPPRLTQLLDAKLQDVCGATRVTQPTGFTKSKPVGQRIVGKTVGTKLGETLGPIVGGLVGDLVGTTVGVEVGDKSAY
jgi:hypothetical protein